MRRYIRISQLANSHVSAPGKADDKTDTKRELRLGMVPVSQATIWRWVQSGKFPAPVKLGANTSAWPVEVIDEWLAARTNTDQSQAQK